MKTSPYTKPDLRERIKRRVMAGSKGGKPGQWSARKAQLLKAEYEKAGGGYTKKKTAAQKSLTKWTKEDWQYSDKSQEGKGRYRPKKVWDKLTAAEKRSLNQSKKRGTKKGKQHVPIPEKLRGKVQPPKK